MTRGRRIKKAPYIWHGHLLDDFSVSVGKEVGEQFRANFVLLLLARLQKRASVAEILRRTEKSLGARLNDAFHPQGAVKSVLSTPSGPSNGMPLFLRLTIAFVAYISIYAGCLVYRHLGYHACGSHRHQPQSHICCLSQPSIQRLLRLIWTTHRSYARCVCF
jgi:hypothetical protein